MEVEVKRFAHLTGAMLALGTSIVDASAATARQQHAPPSNGTLFATVSRLDTGLFDTFNHCRSPAELRKHASYFAPDVEFYHDKGGATRSRHEYIARTKTNACGVYRRELVAGSLEVFPVKGYGAIEQGRHRFCNIRSGRCFGVGRFLILWHHLPGKWEITRAFSYGHHAIHPAPSSRQTH